jgi:hypothetical protein
MQFTELRFRMLTAVSQNIKFMTKGMGASGSVVVKALCYKPEGREFDS